MKAILFDLDGTLVDREQTVRRFLDHQFEKFSDKLPYSRNDFISTVLEYQQNGYADKLEAYRKTCDTFGSDIHLLLYKDFRERFGFDAILFPGTLKALRILSETYRMAIITNGSSKTQNAKIDSSGIRPHFASIKISGEEGVKKPDPEIFHRCLKDLEAVATDSVFVGDHPDRDIRAAQNLGMRTIWIRNSHFAPPDFADATVDSVSEIPSILSE